MKVMTILKALGTALADIQDSMIVVMGRLSIAILFVFALLSFGLSLVILWEVVSNIVILNP